MTAQPPQSSTAEVGTEIAIVGMAAHLPGAGDAARYWENLRAGISAIRPLSDEDLRAAGEDPARMAQPNYVRFAAPLDGFAEFDAEFWGFSPKDAAILDPQHRQFLEVAWEALENAGHVPERFPGPIGVFAGCGMGSYFYVNLCSNPALVEDVGLFLLRHTGNDKDFLSTRLSHILDLRGPSVNVQTACSTSLVAVHYAVQALLTGECDMALAGGVTIELPHGRGYLYKENEILSPDGACHAFDHRAQGTVFGSGAGCVALRRLSDAQRDGDHIWAVIKGTAINNDGAQKAGYLAPSVEGQARCIAEAQAVAGVSAETMGYVECHGTGTYLGDPIEVAAMTEAFRETTDARGFCRIGSVKTNIGHLDTAAGVASLIKAALVLHHGEIPPSLGFEAPNPAIDFETSPFRVNDTLTPWPRGAHPRRAGVNSLGVGGTNAHAILEEAPARGESAPSDWPFELLTLSARSDKALEGAAANLGAHLRARADQPLADVAYTLSEGRRSFARRRVLVADQHTDAANRLERGERVFTHTALSDPDMVFLFPGGGAQYPGMARDLYETEPVFAEWMDRGLEHLQPKLDYDLRALWLPEPGAEGAAAEALKRPSVQLPLIMITEYALAQMLMGWGITPAALIGHSMGENTAAAIAGVMGFEECIDLVHLRGRLFDSVPAGGMLSVPLSAGALAPHLGGLDIASLNAPELTVVSGPDAALADLAARLAAEGVETQRIAIDIAAHSRMLEGILPAFRAHLADMKLSAPRIPVISNSTGQPLTAEQAQSPDYWVNHLRGTVRFADGVETLAQRPNRIWLEVGPGKALSSLVKMSGKVPAQQVLSALRHPDEQVADDRHHLEVLGRIWALGGPIDWAQLRGEGPRRRVPLPGYAFQRQRYFIEAQRGAAALAAPSVTRIADSADWASAPAWLPRAAGVEFDAESELALFPRQIWLFFADRAGMATPVLTALRGAGHKVLVVEPGDRFLRKEDDRYTLAPERGREGYDALMRDLSARGLVIDRIAHFWLCGDDVRPGSSPFQRNMERGFHGLVFLAQALAAEGGAPLHIAVFTTGAANLRGEGMAHPEKTTVLGPARVIPREMPGFTVSVTDLDRAPLPALVLEELLAPPANSTAALRGPRRYAQTMRPAPLGADADLPQGAVWVITGGFGGIGLSLAEDLIRRSGAKIALIARTELPDRADWAALSPADPRAMRVAAVQRLEALGGRVQVLAADVCNLDEMRTALDGVRTALGPIYGVIHAAGAIDDAPLLAKTPAALDAVLSPKLHGLRVLDQLLPDGAVDRLILFSSTSAHVAPAGQVDYVAANAFLNAFAAARTGGRTQVLALGWGVWANVGMAAEAMASRLGHAPTLPTTPTGLPLLPEAGFDRAMNRQFLHQLGPDHWLLDEHRTRDGRALIPGTGVVELFAQALRGHGQIGALTLRDVTFLRALEVDAPRTLRVTVSRSDEGFDLALGAEATLSGRKGFALHAQARATPSALAPEALSLDAIFARCPNRATDPAGLRVSQEAHLSFGPRWRVLNARALGMGEGLARLSLPPAFRADLAEGYVLHPALMDIATGWAMGLIDGYEGASLWVPVSYSCLHIHAALPAEIASWVRLKPAPAGFARFDITLTDPAGNVLLEIEGFTMKRLESGLATPPLLPAEMDFDEVQGDTLSEAEARLARNLALGITPAEGAQAFARALAWAGPEVVISSLPLPALIAEAAQTRTTEGARFERPETSGDYIEPRNDTERRLATIWEELLGINGIGMEDNFFDLGGHSLIAVRLFARVKKAFGADFPISILFEAPTIAALGALIGAPDAAPVRSARRFQFLVPMHDGEGGPRTPFFLVAGMFGNVLNLRQLAALLGRDRPFFGLQARGLFGEAPPHARLDDAARDYIAELRQVQPQGPYLLGGFSGGGLTALEMARIMRAEGEDVALLTLLDTPLPLRPALSKMDKALIKLQEFQRKGPAYAREWWQARQAWKAAQSEDAMQADGEGFHNQAIEAAFRGALPSVALERYDGHVALFRPALDLHWRARGGRWISREKEYVSADNDWGPWMPALEVIEVPGDHDSMVLEPNVRVMAARLKSLIEGRGL